MITNFYKVRINLLSFPNKVLQRSKFITKGSVKKFWSLFSPKTVLKLSKLSTNSKYTPKYFSQCKHPSLYHERWTRVRRVGKSSLSEVIHSKSTPFFWHIDSTVEAFSVAKALCQHDPPATLSATSHFGLKVPG